MENASGSTAGASSAAFHIYRAHRRTELLRLEEIEKRAEEDVCGGVLGCGHVDCGRVWACGCIAPGGDREAGGGGCMWVCWVMCVRRVGVYCLFWFRFD